jgi:hypothetical protein
VLYDLHRRVRRNTWEGVANLRAEAIAYIRDRKIDKLAKYVASAKRHDFFDAADTGYYESLEELNRLRNRFHIQNESLQLCARRQTPRSRQTGIMRPSDR